MFEYFRSCIETETKETMELKKELQNILRVPQPEDVEKMVMMSCDPSFENVSILNPLKKFSVPSLQGHQRFSETRVTSQKPPLEPSTSISKTNHRKRKWNINTIIGHVILVVFHLVQWQKIAQTRGVSAEFLDEELE